METTTQTTRTPTGGYFSLATRGRVAIDPQWLYIASLAGAAIAILAVAVRL